MKKHLQTALKIGLYLIPFLFWNAAEAQKVSQINEEQLIEDIKTLSSDDFAGRKTDTEGNRKAQKYIKKRFESLGLKNFGGSFEQKFTTGYKKGVNLVGYAEGSDSSVYLVLSAHYDHLGVRGDEIFNGADDNASGVSALLAFAEYFSKNKPQYPIIFLATDAEESGLNGAKYFVKNAPVPVKKIILNVNMDMISRNEKKEIFACGANRFPVLKRFFTLDDTKYDIKVSFGHDGEGGGEDWTHSSDHGAFFKVGIPFIYFGVEDHEDYHKTSDTFEKIDQPFYKNVCAYIFDFLMVVQKGLAER